MMLSEWVNGMWYYRSGWTVSGVIGVGERYVVLSAWVDGMWCYRGGWTVSGVIGVGER